MKKLGVSHRLTALVACVLTVIVIVTFLFAHDERKSILVFEMENLPNDVTTETIVAAVKRRLGAPVEPFDGSRQHISDAPDSEQHRPDSTDIDVRTIGDHRLQIVLPRAGNNDVEQIARKLDSADLPVTLRPVLDGIVVPALETRVDNVVFSPDGEVVLTASMDWGDRETDTNIKLWDAETGRLRATLEHESYIGDVAFSPDGKLVAVGTSPSLGTSLGGGGEIKLLDGRTGKLRKTLRWTGDDSINSVAFSPDGKSLAVGQGLSSRGICFFDVASGQRKSIIRPA